MPLLLTFVLAFLLGMAAPVSGAGRRRAICRDIASMLREGLGNATGRPEHNGLVTTLAHNSRGRLTLAPWTYWYPDRGGLDPYLRSLGMPPSSAGAMSTETPITMTASLGRNLVAVVGLDGTMSCMQVHIYYRQKNNLIEAVDSGIAKAMLCERWGYSLWLGSFNQTLFLATVAPDMEHNRFTIDFASWNGHGWDANCGVVANFVPELMPADKVCAMADCAAALRAAKRLAAEAKLADETGPLGIRTPAASTGPPADPEFQRLMVLADRTAGMDSLPRSPELLGSDFLFFAHRILTRVAGHPTLAVVGQWRGGHALDSEPIGAAVGLWQAAGDSLSLVASFHLKPAMGMVRSVYVTR